MRLNSLRRWFSGGESLGDLAATKNIRFGSAVATWHNDTDAAYENLLAQHCRLIVPETEGKPGVFVPTRGVFNLSGISRVADIADLFGAEKRFHTLVWYYGLPQWILDDLALGDYDGVIDILIDGLKSHLLERNYYEVDVCNEVTSDDGVGSYRTGTWYDAAGSTPAFIDYAFTKARIVLPGVRLAINDYSVETTSLYQTTKRNNYLSIIEGMHARGVPFDVVGLQSHLTPTEPLDTAGLASFLSDVTEMGKMVSITELDIVTNGLTGTNIEIDRAVYTYTRQFLDIVFENSNIDTVIVWGLADKFTWWDQYFANTRPLPFGRNLEKKPMYNALRDFFLSL